jgi:VIT1/CCC1 family predicted Fe2+/Mn2+ transporter
VNKKNITFVVSVFSPVFPVLAVLMFNKIGHALPLLIFCMLLAAGTIGAVTALIRGKEKSPVRKVVGTLMGVVGVVIALAVGILSGWTYTKL